ncbi:MAG: hypothetical protein HYU88_04280 [Chloroflexi bacterium]|nr:hypothetical protein [Chloroflexota bacterium]
MVPLRLRADKCSGCCDGNLPLASIALDALWQQRDIGRVIGQLLVSGGVE